MFSLVYFYAHSLYLPVIVNEMLILHCLLGSTYVRVTPCQMATSQALTNFAVMKIICTHMDVWG